MNEKNYIPSEPPGLPVQNANVATVSVAGVDVTRLTYNGQPVVTLAMVDEVHQRPYGTARRNLNENRSRFFDGEDVITLDQPDEIRTLGFSRPQGGTPASVSLLTQRGYLKLTKPMNDDRAWMVQGEMIDHYFATSQGTLLPDFSNPAVAARAFADQYEATQLAIRTKAKIGSRREATAMNTASQATKRANRLAIELDRHHSFATVKRMQAAYKGREFNWRTLKTTSVSMGVAFGKVPDQNYGEVNTYHADVWRSVYGLEIPHEAH